MHKAKLTSFYSTAVSTVAVSELVDMFLAYCSNIELSPTTITTRKSHLKAFCEACTEMGLTDITKLPIDFIDAFFAYSRQDIKKSTLNTRRRVIRAFLSWVRDYKEIDIRARPEAIRICKDQKPEPQAISRAHIQQVIDKCPDYQDKLIIATFVETGMRNSELCDFKVCDIHYDCISILGKGLKRREVYITSTLADALKDYNNGKTLDRYVFTNKHCNLGTRLRTETIRQHLKKHFKEIVGIDVHPHQLRHTFALNLLENGCDIVTIKELMGHSDINTTMVYLRMKDETIKQNYQKHIGKPLLKHEGY